MIPNDDLPGRIIGAALRVHSVLGPGLLERAHQVCLEHELRKRGLAVRSEVPIAVKYDGVAMPLGYRMDLLVEESVAVEIKAITMLMPVHRAQLLSQIRLANLHLGLLFNFHELHLKDGIARLVNNL